MGLFRGINSAIQLGIRRF